MRRHRGYNPPYGVSDPNAPYINGNPATGTMGSIPPAASIEYPQREIVGLIGACGFTPDNADLLQLAKAVQSGLLNFAVDTGTANNYQIAVNPALMASKPGNRWYVKIANTNTGPSTLNINGIGAKPIVYGNGDALSAGDLVVGSIAELWYDGTQFQLCPTHTTHLSGTRVALTGVIMFATPGTFTYTPSAGTRAVLLEVQGAGGGGGGSAGTSSSQVSLGISGGAGAYARKWITSGFSGATVIVGPGGAGGGLGSNGGPGNTSSFGALVSCTGGGGGFGGVTQAIATAGNTTTAGGGSAGGGDINVAGQCSQASISFGSGSAMAGVAGSCMYGTSPIAFGVSTNGAAGNGFGAGGTAGVSLASSSDHTGGAGAGGLVVVWEYA